MVPAVEIAAAAGLAHDRQAAPGWFGRADRSMPDVDADAPRLTEFDWSGGEGGRWLAWGRFDAVSTSGGFGPAAGGRVAAGHAGLEVRSDGLLAGVALSRVDATLKFSGRTDRLEAHVTSVTPYPHGEFDGGAPVGQVAFGRGDLRAVRPGGGASEAGLSWGMMAVGGGRPAFYSPTSSPKCNARLFPRQSGWRRRLRSLGAGA